jgi:uncharacterized repeat protein (TIGR01451 family)
MKETIYNDASTTYSIESESRGSVTETSNDLPLVLNSETCLEIEKTASPKTFSVGSIITYKVEITNNSSRFFTGVRIIDDLGGGHLAYVTGSGELTTDSLTYSVDPIDTDPLTFTLQQLSVGESMTLTFKAQVVFDLPSSVSSITNTVEGIAYTSSGTISRFANETIERNENSDFTIVKSANVESVAPYQSFKYFITLTNGYSEVANVENIKDDLPSNFHLTELQLKIGTGSTTILSSSDYTLSSSNELTVPSSTGPVITVPAHGTTILTITGYFS